jgi:hypothetical protein
MTALTTIGTLVAGAVPASLVTAGTFGAGDYVFPSDLTATTSLTVTGPSSASMYFGVAGLGNDLVNLVVRRTTTSTAGANFVGQKARGTVGAEDYADLDDYIVRFIGRPWDGTGFTTYISGDMGVQASENHSATALGGYFVWNLIRKTTTTNQTAMTLEQDGTLILYGGQGTNAGVQTFFSNGTIGSPAFPDSGDVMGYYSAAGWTGTALAYAVGGAVNFAATQTWTASARGTSLTLTITPNGSTTNRAAWIVGNDSHLSSLAANTNTQDIGRTTAGIRTLYVGTSILPLATDTVTLGASGNGYVELWISHNSSRASGLNLVQTLTGQGSPRLMFSNTTDWPGAGNTIYQIGSNTLAFTTGGTPGSASGTSRWYYNASGIFPITTNAMTLGGASVEWSDFRAVLTTISSTLTTNGTLTYVSQSASTSQLIVGTGTGSGTSSVNIQSAAGQYAIMRLTAGSLARWQFTKDNDAEAGANAGARLLNSAFDDAGAFIDNWLIVTRAALGGIVFASNRPITGGTYNGQTISSAASFTGTVAAVTHFTAPLLIGTTRVTAPLIGTTTAVDVVIDRNSVAQATFGSLTALFAGVGAFGGVAISASTNLNLPAGTTGVSSLRMAHGVAPSAPVDGDFWTTTVGAYARINGASVLLGGAAALGDVVGPASATDNAVALFNSTTGKLIKNSTLIFATGALSGVTTLRVDGPMAFNAAASAVNYLNLGTSSLVTGSTTARGITAQPVAQSDVTTQYSAIYAQLRTQAAAFTLTAGEGIRIASATVGAASSVTTMSGLYVETVSGGSTNYAIYTNGGAVRFGDALTVASGGLTVSSGGFVVLGNSTLIGTLSSITTLTGETLIGSTRVTAPVFGTTTATDVIIDRNSITMVTFTATIAYVNVGLTLQGGPLVFNPSLANVDATFSGDVRSHTLFLDASEDNIALCASSAPAWNSMQGGMFIANRIAAPTGNPTGGGYIYSESGALKWRGSAGTVTTIAPA